MRSRSPSTRADTPTAPPPAEGDSEGLSVFATSMPGLCATLVWLMAGLRMSTPHAQTEMRAMLMGLLDATIHLAFKLDVQIGNAALRAAVEMREALGAAKARQGDEQTGDEQTGDEQAADVCPAGDAPGGVVPGGLDSGDAALGGAGPRIDSSNGDDRRTDQRGAIRRSDNSALVSLPVRASCSGDTAHGVLLVRPRHRFAGCCVDRWQKPEPGRLGFGLS